MKKFIQLFLLFFILGTPSFAKIKVVESSSRKVPTWVNSSQSEYIISSAIQPSIEEARNNCIANVREQIINAAAQNVETSSTSEIQQTSFSSDIDKFVDSFSEISKTESAKIPFLAGISISRVEDSYWEKRVDTETKETSYFYAIKYPFSSLELKKLVIQFMRKDKEMEDKFSELEKLYDNIVSVAQVNKAVDDLSVLVDYFFDSVRKNAAERLRASYSRIYRDISISEVANKLGAYSFSFIYNNKPIIVSTKPFVKSETLSQFTTEQNDGIWTIKYNYDTCDPTELNFADISCNIKDNHLNHKFYADISARNLQITPIQTVYLEGTQKDSLLTGINIRMNIDCDLTDVVTLFEVMLEVPGLNKPIFINNLDVKITGKGRQTLTLAYEEEIVITKKQFNQMGLLKGYLDVSDVNKKIERITISLPFKSDW